MDREIIYLGRDNSIDVVLYQDGSPKNLTGVTDVKVYISGTTISSAASPTLFSGTTSTTGVISMKFGNAAGLSAAFYDAKMIVYHADYTNGILWGMIPVVVK